VFSCFVDTVVSILKIWMISDHSSVTCFQRGCGWLELIVGQPCIVALTSVSFAYRCFILGEEIKCVVLGERWNSIWQMLRSYVCSVLCCRGAGCHNSGSVRVLFIGGTCKNSPRGMSYKS
jgi:hypothetical protein